MINCTRGCECWCHVALENNLCNECKASLDERVHPGAVSAESTGNGNVRVLLWQEDGKTLIGGIVVPPEDAYQIAQLITLNAMGAEDELNGSQ